MPKTKASIESTQWDDGGMMTVKHGEREYEVIMSPQTCIILNSVINSIAQQCVVLRGKHFFLPDILDDDDKKKK